MVEDAYAVILAGGRGERFWPLSTSARPKQLLKLFSGRSLLQRSAEYLRGVIPNRNIVVITSESLSDAVRREIPALPRENIIGEPVGRDTAAACAAGSAWVAARSRSAVFCVLTADHLIGKAGLFRRTVKACLKHARTAGRLVTIGMRPTFPSTAFGYIETGRRLPSVDSIAMFDVKRFVEKPDVRRAQRYCATGRFLWNSGMFFWSVESFWKALAAHCPYLHEMAIRLANSAARGRLGAALCSEYRKIPKISIDYALMEKADNISVARGEFPWDDLGSWPALANHLPSDCHSNTVLGMCQTLDAGGNIVVSEGRLTALVGVKDLIVVHAPQATLVCHKDRAQDVRAMVRLLATRKACRRFL